MCYSRMRVSRNKMGSRVAAQHLIKRKLKRAGVPELGGKSVHRCFPPLYTWPFATATSLLKRRRCAVGATYILPRSAALSRPSLQSRPLWTRAAIEPLDVVARELMFSNKRHFESSYDMIPLLWVYHAVHIKPSLFSCCVNCAISHKVVENILSDVENNDSKLFSPFPVCKDNEMTILVCL